MKHVRFPVAHSPLLVLLIAFLLIQWTTPALSSFPRGLSMYVGTTDPERHARVAARYGLGVTGNQRDLADDVAAITALNSAFRWYDYNSLTDNYVTSAIGTPEQDLLAAKAAEHGWDVEEAYLHFYDDTALMLQGQMVTIPGWGGGSAATEAEARVPVYYSNLTRRVTHFSTPRARQLQMEVIIPLAFGAPFYGTTIYADGIMFDNAATILFNTGTVLSGGHVAEAPGRPVIGSSTFQSWHWNSNIGPFLSALKDSLRTSSSWSPDRRHKEIAINIADTWSPSIISLDVADMLMLEFQYSPVRNFGVDAVMTSYQRCLDASSAGIASYFSPHPTTSVAGKPDAISYAEAMMGGLCWYLVARTESSVFTFPGTGSLSAAGWDTLMWREFADVADQQLGNPIGAPFVLSQGSDPLGHPYKVTARNYSNGLALVRNRGSWDEGIEPATAVTVNLPAAFSPVSATGTVGAPVSTVSLINGQGQFFLTSQGGSIIQSPHPFELNLAFKVLAVSPLAAAEGVSPGTRIRWLLNGPVEPADVTTSNVNVHGSLSGDLDGVVSLDASGTRVTFTPARQFQPGESVRAFLSGTLRRQDGKFLDGNGDGISPGTPTDGYVHNFTVAGTPVVPRRPSNGGVENGD